MTSYWYGNALVRAFTELDAGGANKTPKVMLLGDGYTFNGAHDYLNDVSAEQVAGTGYTAGGFALTGVTYTFDPVTGLFRMDADDLLPGGLSVDARYAVVYYDTGTASTSPLVSCTDFTEVDGEEVTVTGIAVHTSGIVTLTLAQPA